MANKGVAYSLSCLLAVIVAGGGYGVAIKPKLESAEQVRATIEVDSKFRDKMVELKTKTQSVEAEFSTIAAEAAEFNAAFPAASDQSGLLESLNKAAKKAGVEIKTVSPSQAVDLAQITQEVQNRLDEESAETGVNTTADGDPRYTYMTLSLKVSGKANEQRSFLKEIEGLDRKLYIQNVAAEANEGSGNGELNISLITMITAPLINPMEPTEDTESQKEDPAAADAGEKSEGE